MAGDLYSICLFHTEARRAIQLVVLAFAFVQAALVPRASRRRLVLSAKHELRSGVVRSMRVLELNVIVTAKHYQFLLRHGSDR